MRRLERHSEFSQLSLSDFIHQLCVLYRQMLTLPCTICEPLHNTYAEINVHTVGFRIDLHVWGQWTSAMSLKVKGQWALNFHISPTFCQQQSSAPPLLFNIKESCEHIVTISHCQNYLYAPFSLLRLCSIINLIYFLKKSHSHCLLES